MDLQQAVEQLIENKIPESLKIMCQQFLDKYAEIEELQQEMEKIKEGLKEEFRKNPSIKSVDFPEQEYQVQGRDKNTITWNESKLFALIGPSPHALTVFPKVIDKNLLSTEDIKNAGLLEKCTTRRFDSKTMEALLATDVYQMDTFIKEGLMQVTLDKTIARAQLKPKKEKKTGKK